MVTRLGGSMFKKSQKPHKKHNKDPDMWLNKLSDHPAFILGNGYSLNEIDFTYLIDFVTIGINRSFLKFDSTFLMWQDSSLWYHERAKILRTHAIKYCTSYSDPEKRFHNFSIHGNDFILSQSLKNLHGRGTTTPLAVQFAILLGCNPIVLLGCDCKATDNKTDFYGNNKFHHPNTMKQCHNGLLWIKEHISDSKIRTIYSCSNNDVFTKNDFKSIIVKLQHVKRLARSELQDILNS